MKRLAWLALVPAAILAQTNARPAGEARSVESRLESLERGQRVLIVLARIDVDQSRLAALESQRLWLLEREASTRGQRGPGDAAPAIDAGSSESALLSIGPAGERRIVPGGTLANLRAESSTTIAELRRSREAIEQAIGLLKARIEKWEKSLEGLGEATGP